MPNRIKTTDMSGVADLSQDTYTGFANRICRFIIEVPSEFIQRTEVGPLMAFSVNNDDLYQVMLAAKRAYVNFFVEDKVNITIEVAEAYLPLAYGDLKKVKGAYLIRKDDTQADVQEDIDV